MPTLNPNISVNADTTLSTSGLNNLNFLQPTSFQLSIDRRHFSNLQFFCQTVLHPSLNTNAIEVPYQRISTVPLAGDKLTFTELTVIIIVDENLNSYTEMYNWMQRVVQTPDRPATKADVTKPPTYCDMTLSILSSHNNKIRQIKYNDSLPVSLGDMTLESTSGDVQFITFPATFRFSTFELK
jgi:hypothetical protein